MYNNIAHSMLIYLL